MTKTKRPAPKVGEKKFLQVEVVPIEQAATTDLLNTNLHSVRGRGREENSIRRRGLNRPIAAAGMGVDVPVISAGNQTFEIANEIGIKEAIVVHTRGDQVIINVRDDVAPNSAEFHALAIEDNVTSQDFQPDVDLIAQLAAGDSAVLAALQKDDKAFAGMLEGMLVEAEDYIGKEELSEKSEEIRPRKMLHILISVDLEGSVKQVLEVREKVGEIEKLSGVEVLYGAN